MTHDAKQPVEIVKQAGSHHATAGADPISWRDVSSAFADCGFGGTSVMSRGNHPVEGSGHGYLRTACDYVHLNPVRAGLLKAEERLLAYPWSSFGYYLAAPEHRPHWIRVERLLGEHSLQQDSVATRQEFERRTEAVGLRKETTLSDKQIADRLHSGTPASASVCLLAAMRKPSSGSSTLLGNLKLRKTMQSRGWYLPQSQL
jgi:hypothetical protein